MSSSDCEDAVRDSVTTDLMVSKSARAYERKVLLMYGSELTGIAASAVMV